VKVLGEASVAQRTVQLEVLAQSRLQLDAQVNAHVEPLSQLAVPLAPIETLHVAALVQSMDALTPARIVHRAMSQRELVLSPTVTSHVAPFAQSTLHDIAHVPAQLVPVPHVTCWLAPPGIVQAYPAPQPKAPGIALVHPGPGHVVAMRPPSLPPTSRPDATLPFEPHPPNASANTTHHQAEVRMTP
jgi:hypothetical protein